MYIISQDTKVFIERVYYCFLSAESDFSSHADRIEIMKIYWNYSNSDGWASISEEYIFVNDIRKMTQALKAFECGAVERLDIDLWGRYTKCPFVSLHVWKKGIFYAVDLKVYEGTFDEQISIRCFLNESEWKNCSDELLRWGEVFQLQLGDKVETLIHYDDTFFPLGRVGEVTEIHPETEEAPSCVAVSFIDIGWDKKPYQNTRLYKCDEVKRVIE